MATQLNEGQQLAVEHLCGRLLITAGAGSGKTRTLAERFAHAVSSRGAQGGDAVKEVDRILTITYTEKAAGELSERVRGALLGRGLCNEARAVDGAWISTIHTFCARVLRREALTAGIDPGFGVVDEVAAAALSGEAFEQVASARLERGCAGTARLFDLYGYLEARKAVSQIASTLHARGIPVGSIGLEETDAVEAIVSTAVEVFSSAGEQFAGYSGAAKTPREHHAACGGVLESLDRLVSAGYVDESSAAEQVWRTLLEYRATKRSTADTKECVEDLFQVRDELAERCIRVVTRSLGEAFLGLVDDYLALYGELKQARGLFDFDDLIVATRELFASHPEVLEKYRNRFRLVMVDEFQDTDAMQLAFIEAVGEPDLATVGDVRQSIYSFRGADVSVYRRHREEMAAAGAVTAQLTENFRSHADIIDFVNTTFGSDGFFGAEDVGLISSRVEPRTSRIPAGVPRVEFALVDTSDGAVSADSLRAEARIIAERFTSMRESGFEASGMAVLLRAYADAPVFASALERAGFTTTVVGGDRFFDLHEIAALRALCRVIANPHDEEALAALLVSELAAIDDDLLATVVGIGEDNGRTGTLWDALRESQHRDTGGRQALADLIVVIENARQRVGAFSLATVIIRAVEELGLAEVLAGRGVAGRLAWANVLQFCRTAAAFERSGGAGPAGFVAALDAEEASGLRQSAVASVGEGGTVTIMSIHAAKGLEFPVVAVPTLGKKVNRPENGFCSLLSHSGEMTLTLKLPASVAGDKKWPIKSRGFEEAARQRAERECAEAKRLFYVACTRAEDVLILVGSGKPDKIPDSETPLSWLAHTHGALLATAPEGDQGASTVRVGDSLMRVEVRTAGESRGEQEDAVGSTPRRRPATSGVLTTGPVEEPRAQRPERLSFSDIDLYRRCSLRYWAERVARMKSANVAGSASSFGSALHAVLQLAGETGEVPSPGRMAAIGRGLRLSAPESDRLGEVATRFLTSEYACESLIGKGRRNVEVPFAIRVGGGVGPLLVGAIDVYESSGSEALLLDYKSGRGGVDHNAGDDAETDAARYRLQAECYALVAMRDGAEKVTVRFLFPEVFDVEGNPRAVDFEYTSCERDRIEGSILETWQRMGAEPYCDRGTWSLDPCGGCPAAGTVCRLTPPRRGSG